MFTLHGYLEYDPRSEDATRKGHMNWWMKVNVHSSLGVYYAAWVKKEMKLHVNRPLWGSHITVNRGEVPRNQRVWKKYEGRAVEFEYDPILQMNDQYCWLTVKSQELESIRKELGLHPVPRVPFHITVGNFKNTVPLQNKPVTWVKFPWEN